MPVTHQLNIVPSFSNSPTSALKADAPIGIIGIAETATFPINQVFRVRKEADLASLGGTADNTILPEVKILQNDYGCNNIFVIRVPKGADAAATENNIIGSEATILKTGLGLFKENLTFLDGNCHVDMLLIPGYSSANVVTKALEVCNAIDAIVYLDFPTGTTTAQALTTRGTATGLGTKNPRLVPCHPRVLRNSATPIFESLATHAVGVTARTILNKGFGFTASNESMCTMSVAVDWGFSTSYTDPNADNQKLENAGVLSVNVGCNCIVLWGNRNAAFVSGTTEGIETYIVVQRIKQQLTSSLLRTGNKFLDEECSYGNAKLLETALNNVIASLSTRGNLRLGSRATLNENLSDFTARKLVYDIAISSVLPIEVITLNTQFAVQL